MKSSFLYAGAALACALGLSACGGGSGDLPLVVNVVGGVTKEGLVLVNKNNGDEVKVPAGATSVQFSKYLSTDDQFDVEVKAKPTNVSECKLANNKARANYYTVYTQPPTIGCTIITHDLNVTVNGLTSNGLVLVNGSDRVPVAANPANPVKITAVPEDGPYGVTILTQPDNQTCAIAGGTGTMTATGPSSAPVVTCGPKS